MAMLRLVFAALIFAVAGDTRRSAAAGKVPAVALAKDEPCSVPAAIFGHAPRQGPRPPRTQWERVTAPGCGRIEDLPLRPIKLRLGEADLLRRTPVCPNGFERFAPRPGIVEYYWIGLTAKDADNLRFDVTEGWIEYDANLKVVHDVIAGCSTAAGTLSIRR
jgi:hypothetical protein